MTSSRILLSLVAAVLVLLASSVPGARAQLQSGQNNCRGWDIQQSKYCPAFSRHLLGPTNFTDILFFAMVRDPNKSEDVDFVRNLRADNIQSAADFDSKIMEGIFLDSRNLPDLNHRWFRCRFETLGVQYSVSWWCNMLLNPLSGSCPKGGAPNPPSLCRDSLTETFQSAQKNVNKDESCKAPSIDPSKFADQLNRVYSNFYQFNRTASTDTTTCIFSKINEDPRKLCGWPTLAMACANKCPDAQCPGTGGGNGGGSTPGTGGTLNPGSKEGNEGTVTSNNTLVVVLSVVGSIVLVGAAAVGFVMYRRRQQQNPHAQSLYVSSSESGFGGSNALGKPTAGNGKLGPYSMAERGAADIDVPTVGRAGSGLAMSNVPAGGGTTAPVSSGAPVLPLDLPMPLSPTGTGNGSAEPVLIRRPPSTKLSTLTPPPRTSFYENDDMESIAPEDSASNVGVNPRYRPGSNFRPSSALLVPGTNGAPMPGKPTSPLASNAKAEAAAAAAAAAEAVNTLPAVGRVTLPNGLVAHMVFHTYHPRLDDELQVAPKDLLHVTEVYSDGWGRATQVDPATGNKVGKSGVFPVAALEPVVSPSQLSGSAAGAGSQVKAQQVPLPGSPQ